MSYALVLGISGSSVAVTAQAPSQQAPSEQTPSQQTPSEQAPTRAPGEPRAEADTSDGQDAATETSTAGSGDASAPSQPSQSAAPRTKETPAGGVIGGTLSRARERNADAVVAYTLPNGLRVRLEPDPTRPRAAVAVSYYVGTRDEGPELRGLAHLTEHLMFRGSPSLGNRHYMAALAELAASDANATTGRERTNYFVQVPSGNLERLLFLEAERMAYAITTVSEETFDRELGVVENEYRQNRKGTAGELIRTDVERLLFPEGHPFHGGSGGPPASFALTDFQWFMQHWVRPDNAVLAIVGDFDEAQVRGWVERYFGEIRAHASVPLPARNSSDALAKAAGRFVDIDGPSEAPSMTVMWPTPPYCSPMDAELDIVADALVGPAGALRRALVDRRLARHVSAGQVSGADGSYFEVSVQGYRKGDEGALAKAVYRVLTQLHREGIDQDVFESARHRWAADARRPTSLIARAVKLAQYSNLALMPGGYFDPEVNALRYESMTHQNVDEALRAYLDMNHAIVTLVEYDPRMSEYSVDSVENVSWPDWMKAQ